MTVRELANQFLVAKSSLGRSDRYLRQLRHVLGSFCRGRARKPAAAITPSDFEDWLRSLRVGPRTIRGHLGDWRTVYAWAIRRGWLQENPAARVEVAGPGDGRPIRIHTPDQVRAVLEAAFAADASVGRHLAVRYFGGLRTAEAHRIREDALLLDRGMIEVSAARSKTRSRRLVQIQPALAAWLALGGTLRPLSPNTIKAAIRTAGVPWEHNATRHSFVSYHLAAFGSAARTALEAGHSENILFRHYRALVSADQAAEFWAIRPAASSH